VFGLTELGTAKINKAVGNVQTINIAKVIDASHSAANAGNIISAFRNARISPTPMAVTDAIDELRKPYPVWVVTPETCGYLAGKSGDEDYVSGLESDEEEFDEEEDASGD
jgi:hypothetical protein